MSNPHLNPEKARRAATAPNRPGELCRAAPGTWIPVVDRRRCEGKRDCLEVCPYEVFEIRTIEEAEYRALPPLTRFKLWVHGKQTAYTPRANLCQSCGLCVVACPEKAITLQKVQTEQAPG